MPIKLITTHNLPIDFMSEYENSVNQNSTDNKATIHLKGMSLADLELYGIKQPC